MSRLDHLGNLSASTHIIRVTEEPRMSDPDTQRKQAAARALEEAQARRDAHIVKKRAAERGGQEGPEPTRFGDWEKAGIICDF